MATSKKQIARAIVTAANYIKKHGLAKRTYEDADGRVCTSGAIRKVITGSCYGATPKVQDVITTLAEHLREEYAIGASVAVIPHWNDYECETEEEVIDYLKNFAKQLRSE